MYYRYDKSNSIHVPEPFCRAMTPCMMADSGDGEPPFSIHYTEWEPGKRIDSHLHEHAMEAMICVAGAGKATLNGVTYDFVPDSMIVADKFDEHSIYNDGTETLRVLCVFSPAIKAQDLKDRALAAVRNALGTGETEQK